MKRKQKQKQPEPVKRRRSSPRARMERELGRKLLKGEIPVTPPSMLKLPRCPVPANVEGFQDVCRDYEAGKIGYEDVLAKVGESLKKPKPEAQLMGDYAKGELQSEGEKHE